MAAAKDRAAPRTELADLPASPSSFVGRSADLEALALRFEEGAQLVTITGLGGMGKTRLALRFAETQAQAYTAPGAGGVWFCDLSGIRGPVEACAAVAAAVGVQLSHRGGDLAERLGRALARRGRLLLVLDNFEQLAAHAAATVGIWQRASPRIRLLVTSRVALGVVGEHLWCLRPLELPATSVRDPAVIAATSAVVLFLRRARQRRPDLVVGDEDLEAAAEIVRRLDGIPLAIELAAARLTALSIPQLRDRLVDRLGLLVRRGDDGRHASMRRTIADAWEQLGPAEARCLAGCTIFAGGFSVAAAEVVLAAEGAGVLADLESLCLRSLVRATPRPDLDGELRFSLYETIREFAAERLAATPGAGERLAKRHTAYFTEFGRSLAAAATSTGGPAARRLDLELDNLLAACARALDSDSSAAQALSLATTLCGPLLRRGVAGRARELLDRALDRADAEASAAACAAARLARARALRALGAAAEARRDLDAAIALALAAGDRALEASAHAEVGALIELEGATEDARARFATALACLAADPEGARHPLREAGVRTRLAHAYRREGDLSRAAEEIRRALELHRAADRSADLPWALYEAGVIAWFRGRTDEGLARVDEGLALVADDPTAHHPRGALLYVRAALLQDRGDLDGAFDRYVRALALIRVSGDLYLEASALYYFAGAHLERGLEADAATLLGRALAMFRELGVPRYQALIESCRATLFAAERDLEAAARSLEGARRAAAACRSEGALTATVAIHDLHVRMIVGDEAHRPALLAEARRLAEAHPSDDSRFALRVASAGLPRKATGPSDAPLIVRAGARSLRLPGATADLDLRRRLPLRRIVLALARRRIAAPGEALSLEELLAAGWPDERVGDSAAANRVHVALSTLRKKFGLRPYLLSGRDGYALTSAFPCVLEPEPEPAPARE
ncbi:MAG: AAA family ATPase [Nannocystaceae bacterium]